MLIDELKKIAKESGVVGAGGAGFPSYAKMTEQADTVILNCVECEPLLKLHKPESENLRGTSYLSDGRRSNSYL